MKIFHTLCLFCLPGVAFLLVSCNPKAQIPGDTAMQQRAVEIAHEVIITDGHIDFPYHFRHNYGTINASNAHIALESPKGEFDYVRAKAGGLDAPFMSIYIPASYQETGGAKELADSLIDFVHFITDQYPDKFGRGRTPAEVNENFEKGLVSLPMGMENGAPIGDDLDLIDYFYDRGIRYITLTHSKWNLICDSSYDPERKWNGLSPFGYDVVKRMNKTGVMIDVSHISDSAFYQVIRTTKTPVIATHSSCRHFTPGFERNMSDDMIRMMKDNGGVIQINFGSDFLDGKISKNRDDYAEKWTEYREKQKLGSDEIAIQEAQEQFKKQYRKAIYSDVARVADHIDRVVRLAGIDHVGLGSDFDGVGDSLPEGLKDVSQFPNLIEELLRRGYSRDDIEKVCYRNVWRVWNAVEDYAHKN